MYSRAFGSGIKYAAYLDGNVHVTGVISVPSDSKFKKEITPLIGSLEKIMKLKPKSYFYKTEEFDEIQLPNTKRVGLIAQELETVFPEFVCEESMLEIDTAKTAKEKIMSAEELAAKKEAAKYKSIDYFSLIPVLVNAIQEQQKEIEELKEFIRK